MRRLTVLPEQYELAMQHAPDFADKLPDTGECFSDRMMVLNAFSKLAFHLNRCGDFHEVLAQQKEWQQINMLAAAGHVSRDERMAERARSSYQLVNLDHSEEIDRTRTDRAAGAGGNKRIDFTNWRIGRTYGNALEAWREFPESDILASLVEDVMWQLRDRKVNPMHVEIMSQAAPDPTNAYEWTDRRFNDNIGRLDPALLMNMFIESKDPAFVAAAYAQLVRRYAPNERGKLDLGNDAITLGAVYAESKDIDGDEVAEENLTKLVMAAEPRIGSEQAALLYDAVIAHAEEYVQDPEVLDVEEILATQNPVIQRPLLDSVYLVINTHLQREYRGTPKEPSHTLGKSSHELYPSCFKKEPVQQDAPVKKKRWRRS